jgi:hypothetical protein
MDGWMDGWMDDKGWKGAEQCNRSHVLHVMCDFMWGASQPLSVSRWSAFSYNVRLHNTPVHIHHLLTPAVRPPSLCHLPSSHQHHHLHHHPLQQLLIRC